MRSRSTVADPLRRWLELQRDLGGDEVIVDSAAELVAAMSAPSPKVARPVVATPKAPPTTAETSLKPTTRPATSPPPPRAPAAAEPKSAPIFGGVAKPFGDLEAVWRKGAPEIPGPGLAVGPPAANVAKGAIWTSLEQVAAVVAECRACPLCQGRTNTVPGEGNPAARLMCVGEGPGETEDRTGRPFVGKAGELLDKILANIEVPREQVYIANVVKCRPPRNRAPLPDEREACSAYLHRQIALVRPKVLLALGSTAAEALLGVKKPLGDLRLRVHAWDGIPLIVTYHPAALLRNPNWKRPAWDDVRIARQLLELDA
jgi:DNA polymerase